MQIFESYKSDWHLRDFLDDLGDLHFLDESNLSSKKSLQLIKLHVLLLYSP